MVSFVNSAASGLQGGHELRLVIKAGQPFNFWGEWSGGDFETMNTASKREKTKSQLRRAEFWLEAHCLLNKIIVLKHFSEAKKLARHVQHLFPPPIKSRQNLSSLRSLVSAPSISPTALSFKMTCTVTRDLGKPCQGDLICLLIYILYFWVFSADISHANSTDMPPVAIMYHRGRVIVLYSPPVTVPARLENEAQLIYKRRRTCLKFIF